MTGLPSLLGALGLVALLFALLSFLFALLRIPTELGWILANLGAGIVLLGSAAAMNVDGLRERIHSGEAKRASKYGSTAIFGTLLSIGILGMLGFLAERHHVRWDWSEQKVHSLSDQSEKVLRGLERDVEVVALFPPFEAAPIRDLLDRYEYVSDRFRVVEFADPNARPDLLQKYQITPEQLGNGVLRISLGDESVEVSEVGESTVTNAMVKLSRTSEKTVYFLEGHNERAIEGEAASDKNGYSRAAEALRNENYNVAKLLLAAKGDVPDDADVVIIAGPTRPLLQQERSALHRYLARGGAVMALVDPRAKTDLLEDLEQWGVEIGDDVVVDRQLAVFGRATTPFAQQYSTTHEITRDFRETTLFNMVRSVRANPDSGSSLSEIVFTGAESWAERDLDRFFSEGEAELGGDDLAGPVSIAIAGTVERSAADDDGDAAESKPGRLVVVGDADFASNEMVDAYLNRDLFVNAANWLLGDVEAIAVRPNTSRASRFQPTAEQFQRIRMLSLFVLPQLLAVIGVFTWWSRRHKVG
ncbi:MAG: GldG family protein [Deltaproteobacteria bacterium]|nr:GldG family protein [Deltaproteobacteria bacterium]